MAVEAKSEFKLTKYFCYCIINLGEYLPAVRLKSLTAFFVKRKETVLRRRERNNPKELAAMRKFHEGNRVEVLKLQEEFADIKSIELS